MVAGQTVNLLSNGSGGSTPSAPKFADVTRMVMDLTCNEAYAGSIPVVGFFATLAEWI